MRIRHSILCFLLILICAGGLLGRLEMQAVDVDSGGVTEHKVQWTIVIDAGHGGVDPGKIGVNGVHEKDINLAIALLLERYFQSQNIRVVMTRREDAGLYEEQTENKKSEDMKNRIALIEAYQGDILISVHQNSFTDSRSRGAQVFYYEDSQESQLLAQTVQQQLIAGVDPENTRQAKGNREYYLLKKSPSLAIICECGFLSNPQECQILSTEDYQQKIAWNIYMGVMQYINNVDNK